MKVDDFDRPAFDALEDVERLCAEIRERLENGVSAKTANGMIADQIGAYACRLSTQLWAREDAYARTHRSGLADV